VLTRKEQSRGYPDWGFARMLRPGSRFTFYLLVHNPAALPDTPALHDLLAGRPTRVRLGKFPAKARLQAEPARRVVEREGPFFVDAYLNWRDLEADPLVCDVVAASLPTRLIARARFDTAPHYEAHFGDEAVYLPARMRFLARPPQQKSGREADG